MYMICIFTFSFGYNVQIFFAPQKYVGLNNEVLLYAIKIMGIQQSARGVLSAVACWCVVVLELC